jgi:hypothetical protein
MATEDVFNAATGAFSMYGGLLKDVAEEIGMEGALRLHAKQGENFGVMLAGMLQDRLGNDELNIRTVRAVFSNVGEGMGMAGEVEETPTKVSFLHLKCPVYEGLKMAGWDHEDIGTACNCMADAELAELTKAYSQLTGCVKFRSRPDEPCVEEFSLEA